MEGWANQRLLKQIHGQGSPSREGRFAKKSSKLTVRSPGKTMQPLALAFAEAIWLSSFLDVLIFSRTIWRQIPRMLPKYPCDLGKASKYLQISLPAKLSYEIPIEKDLLSPRILCLYSLKSLFTRKKTERIQKFCLSYSLHPQCLGQCVVEWALS